MRFSQCDQEHQSRAADLVPTIRERRDDDHGDLSLKLEDVPDLPGGEYVVLTGRGRKTTRFTRSVYELPCTIQDHPDFAGVALLHYANLPPWSPRKRRFSRVSRRSKLAREVFLALGNRWPARRDGFSLAVLENKLFRARVELPDHDARNRPIPLELRRPVVAELLERLA